MTTREKILTAVAIVCIAGVAVVGAAAGSEGDAPEQVVQEFVCTDGQWSDATIAGDENDGSLSQSIRADVDDGSIETYSGDRTITTHDDGRVEGEGGKLTVTCATPTH